uniref:EXPERA domain-containing protein n=1 Tax=Mantoniella antarctica TaxID=81844 RepID=A0A7S0SF29_9CHLO
MALNATFRAVVCVFFLTHIPATILMDSQAILPASMVPGFAKELLAFHIDRHHDPLMAQQPVWFKSLILFEILFQLPFFFVGFYAFYMRRNWVRIPGIVYGVHTATTLLPILAEITYSKAMPTKQARTVLFYIYLPYLIIPALIALLLALEEKPFGKAGDAGAVQRTGDKAKRR